MGGMEISGAASANALWDQAADSASAVPAVDGAPSAQDSGQRSLAEMIREAHGKAQEQRERLKLPKNTRYGDAPLEAYARLNRARTQPDVAAAAGYARRRISQLQAAKRQDSENADRIQAAINQLQKAVSRASKKKRDLQHEKLLDVRRARMERESQLRQAQQAKQELARRRTARSIRESGYLREAEIDNRLQDQLSATRMELRAQAQALASATSTSLDSAAQQYSAAVSTAAPPPPAAEIDVQA